MQKEAKSRTDPGSATNRGYDHSAGYGFRLGWQGDFFKDVTVGASYKINELHTVHMSFTRSFSDSITGGSVNLGPVQTVKLLMDQYDGIVGYSYGW